jgi:hypothetical protein
VVGPGGRRRRRSGHARRRRGRLVPLVTEENGAVLVVACLHPAAERDQIFVGIDQDAFGGLRSTRIVLATVEGHPAASKLATSTDLRPGQSTAHALFLEFPLGGWRLRSVRSRAGLRPSSGGSPLRARSVWAFPTPRPTDNRAVASGQERGVAPWRHGDHPFRCAPGKSSRPSSLTSTAGVHAKSTP